MTKTDILLDLTRRYCEPHRYYHDLSHVADLLTKARLLNLNDCQIMAIWFHDAIYDPKSKSNEIESAILAQKMLWEAGWNNNDIGMVYQIVVDTKNHVPTSHESAIVQDLDMSTLAAPWSVFQQNSISIREEYNHVSEEDWIEGRLGFLSALLKKDNIYHTEWGWGLEAPARENLQRAKDEFKEIRDERKRRKAKEEKQ